MGKVQSFEDLIVFQKARTLCKSVYEITNVQPFKSDYRFVQQIRAAAGSVMDNIAEGYERDGNKEFVNFLYIAKGSCGEVKSQLLRASDVGFIEKEIYGELSQQCIEIGKLLFSLISSIRQSDVTGIKYRDS